MTDYNTMQRHLLLALVLALLAGCASAPPWRDERSAPCRALFTHVDAAIQQQQVRDQGPAVIDGFPYLRVTRLLASFRDEVDTPERFNAWVGQMAALDAQARFHELRNLPVRVNGMEDAVLLERLDQCRHQLIATELVHADAQRQLRNAAQVEDDYVTWWRVAGLYPVTAPLVSIGIKRWHNETQQVFATPLHDLPVQGTLTRWHTPRGTTLGKEQVRHVIETSRDALGLPLPDAQMQAQLFDTFAPLWEVDVVSDDDRIGAPYWHEEPAVDITQPVLYRLLSHTRFDGNILLQLNYIIWFPSRPGNDIYAGLLDGINWRVTLGPDGTPWLYDLIHNCGCYYHYLPSRHLQLRKDLPSHYFETPLMPQAAPEQQPLVLRIASATHYLQRAYYEAAPATGTPLTWRDYDTLRSLSSGDGYHSLFDAHGIITASQRPERFLLWPMGIRSPGGMRQWHRHAIAFVGRRHFDDAYLLDALFEPVNAP